MKEGWRVLLLFLIIGAMYIGFMLATLPEMTKEQLLNIVFYSFVNLFIAVMLYLVVRSLQGPDIRRDE
ncbi:MAG: hypothetical protein QXH45_06595 [Thermosphaera sp.]